MKHTTLQFHVGSHHSRRDMFTRFITHGDDTVDISELYVCAPSTQASLDIMAAYRDVLANQGIHISYPIPTTIHGWPGEFGVYAHLAKLCPNPLKQGKMQYMTNVAEKKMLFKVCADKIAMWPALAACLSDDERESMRHILDAANTGTI